MKKYNFDPYFGGNYFKDYKGKRVAITVKIKEEDRIKFNRIAKGSMAAFLRYMILEEIKCS